MWIYKILIYGGVILKKAMIYVHGKGEMCIRDRCDNVRASYDEIPKATQDEVFSGARAFVK